MMMTIVLQSASNSQIRMIPNNREKYMTFQMEQLQFIDSIQFVNLSLEKLINNLMAENFAVTHQYCLTNTDLITRIGVYP